MANPLAGLQVQFSDGDRLHVHIVTHRLDGGKRFGQRQSGPRMASTSRFNRIARAPSRSVAAAPQAFHFHAVRCDLSRVRTPFSLSCPLRTSLPRTRQWFSLEECSSEDGTPLALL